MEAVEAALPPPEVGRVSSLEVAMIAAATTSLTLLYRLIFMKVTQTSLQLSHKLTYGFTQILDFCVKTHLSTKVTFFHQCSKMQIIPIKNLTFKLVFSNFFGFSD